MGLALFTASRLFAPLHDAMNWLLPGRLQEAWAHHQSTTGRTNQFAIKSIAPNVHTVRTSGRNNSNTVGHRPLRVLRVVEASAAPSSAGRMVISGRLADVCAELDRLAASEAILH